jgi:hypothetical protein
MAAGAKRNNTTLVSTTASKGVAMGVDWDEAKRLLQEIAEKDREDNEVASEGDGRGHAADTYEDDFEKYEDNETDEVEGQRYRQSLASQSSTLAGERIDLEEQRTPPTSARGRRPSAGFVIPPPLVHDEESLVLQSFRRSETKGDKDTGDDTPPRAIRAFNSSSNEKTLGTDASLHCFLLQ